MGGKRVGSDLHLNILVPQANKELVAVVLAVPGGQIGVFDVRAHTHPVFRPHVTMSPLLLPSSPP